MEGCERVFLQIKKDIKPQRCLTSLKASPQIPQTNVARSKWAILSTCEYTERHKSLIYIHSKLLHVNELNKDPERRIYKPYLVWGALHINLHVCNFPSNNILHDCKRTASASLCLHHCVCMMAEIYKIHITVILIGSQTYTLNVSQPYTITCVIIIHHCP